MDQTSLIEETELLCLPNNIILITGEPGIGKTNLLKNWKKNYSLKYWTFFVCAKDMIEILEYGTDYKLLHKYSKLDISIFDIMYSKLKVVFFWDGLDELFGYNLEKITQIIQSLAIKGFKQFISCRNAIVETLETRFNTFAHKLQPLTEHDQKWYIEKRLFHSDEKKIQKVLTYIKLAPYSDILCNPLQMSMLIDLIEGNIYMLGAALEDIICVTTLYRYSLDQKLCLYLNKTKKSYDEYYKAYLLTDLEKASLKCFTQADLFQMVDDEEIKNFLHRLSTEKYINGIIVDMTTSEKPTFLHRSYGEYLTATYLFKHHTKIPQFQNFIFFEEFRNVRFMFDMLMSENCSAHLAVLYKNYELLLKYEDEINLKDKGGRSPLHLACSWTETYPTLEVDLIDKWFVINVSEDKMITEDNINEKILSKLFDSCNLDEKDYLYRMNAVAYAERALCLFAMNMLAEKHTQMFWSHDKCASILYYAAKYRFDYILPLYVKIPLVKTNKGETLLHVAAKYNNINLLKKLTSDGILNINALEGDEDFTPLHFASLNGHEVVVKQLLACNAYVNVSNKHFCTPLHLAAVSNHYEIVKLLLEHNADVNAAFENGDTCLMAALLQGFFPLVELLLQYGANVKLCNKSAYGPIIIPCLLGHDEMLKKLLQHDNSVDLNTPFSKDIFPICTASDLGHYKVVKLLLDYGANLYVERDDKNPLYIACFRGHYNVAKLLIDYKINVNVTNKFGATPLHAASLGGPSKLIKLLIKHNADINCQTTDGCTPIFIASLKGQTEIVDIFLQNKVDVNIANSTGSYPIHAAVIGGKIKIVNLLINYQCDVNVANKDAITPIHLASELGHYEIVKLLINSGAVLESLDRKGQAALYKASTYNNWRIVELLVESQADANKLTFGGWAPIHIAAYSGHYNAVKTLLENKVSSDSKTTDGHPTIYLATESGHYEVVQLLISHGVDVNATTSTQNATSIHIATLLGYTNIFRLLLQNGAMVNAANKNCYTCIYLASQQGNYDIVKLLIEFNAEVNCATDRGNTPLQAACSRNFILIAKLLLEAGANINHVDVDGDTPLHDACAAGYIEIVELLVKYNADIGVKNLKNQSPLDIVKEKDNSKIVDILNCNMKRFY